MKTTKCKRCNGTGHIINDTETGAEMVAFRKQFGVSAADVARKLRIKPTTISEKETNRVQRRKGHWSRDLIRQYKTAVLEIAKGREAQP